MLIVFPALAQVAGFELPKWLGFALIVAFVVAVTFIVLADVIERLRFLGWIRAVSRKRETAMVVLFGALIGAAVAPWIWSRVRPDSNQNAAKAPFGGAEDSENTEALVKPEANAPLPEVAKPTDQTALGIRKGESVTVSMAPLIPDPNQKPANPDDLEFYFFAFTSSVGTDYVQFADVTVTNRSPRKMHLELWGYWDYWKDSGEPGRHGTKADWNPDGLKEHTGQAFIDLDAWDTKKGRVVLFIGKPPEKEISRWFVDATKNVYFEVFDSVSGKRAAFKPAAGYPTGQMPAPLPSHKQLLALDFPELTSNDPEGTSVIPKLDAIVRTRNQTRDGSRAQVQALFKNSSSMPMEIVVRVLVRSVEDEKVFAAVQGLFKRKNAPDDQRLTIEPGATEACGLSFDMAPLGVTDDEVWEFSDSPKSTVLEIADLRSGQKVWCAFNAGYPPGVDMRSATIIDNPEANSAKPQLGDSKDSK